MTSAVQIRTGSRLHFGPLAVGATAGRSFGGIGLMLDGPATELRVVNSESDRVIGGGDAAAAMPALLDRVRQQLPRPALPRVSIEVRQSIPRHRGLGSGTQLALATAQAVCGATVVPASRLARWTGRGQRSAVGVHGFEHGGFLVDAGKRDAESLGTLAARASFPPDWPILLWMPDDRNGLSGADERAAFARLPAMPSQLSDRLSAIVVRELLPALHDHDWPSFSQGLRGYGDFVGAYFAAAQGGVWADPRAADVVAWLNRQGVQGTAQSSWGPTIAAVLPDALTAHRIQCEWPFGAATLVITQARNRRADIGLIAETPAAAQDRSP